MNIILLSGGSGKRLWPLSNDIRSKQFLKLFKDDEGRYESMLQRVCRQLLSVDPAAQITVATGRAQQGAVRHQLGDRVQVCMEPCRRDTLPAIALATAYLHHERGLGDDETVVVCPVDPYVDGSFFEAVVQAEQLATQGSDGLTLIGVEPTYPSAKYGYIIPADARPVSRVSHFHEKPDRATAEQYIAQGALWNAGIFAFRVSYLLELAHGIMDFDDYRDLYNRYDALPAMSFDHAVAETERNARVLRYRGGWRDVGTWNTITDVMADTTKGPATLGRDCSGTHVINELDIPILCMGCHDMVVAASGDGILVTDKEQSGYMNPYVDGIMNPDTSYAEKSWGTYRVIDAQPGAVTIKISIGAGQHMSYHSHQLRDEVWTVLSGRGRAIIDDMEQLLRPGDVVTVAAGCRHTVEALTDMQLIEVQVGEEISATDKAKFTINLD